MLLTTWREIEKKVYLLYVRFLKDMRVSNQPKQTMKSELKERYGLAGYLSPLWQDSL